MSRRQSRRFYLGAGFFLLAGLAWMLVSIQIPRGHLIFLAFGLMFLALGAFWIRKAVELRKKGN